MISAFGELVVGGNYIVCATVFLMLIIIPYWTSFLIRVYAWMGILNTNGLLNDALLKLGWVPR